MAVVLLLLAGCRGESARSEEKARILSHVRALAQDIGPRPCGSPGDLRAQEYILRRMEEAGLRTQKEDVGLVRIASATDVAVRSANLVGVLEGSEHGAILLGAHHDSRNAACPGASDDASGVAVVLEAARILAKLPHRHTLIFASFAGEETLGLPGSQEFLRTWKGDPIRLAITLDFVGTGRVFVAPFPVPPELWANRLLARAEARVRTGRVSFDPWLAAVPRLLPVPFAADHASFLAAGIPAMNLSCEFPAWIYHTAQDRPERTDSETLLAARDLAVSMIGEADSRSQLRLSRDPGYLPLVLFGHPFFISEMALRVWALLVGLFGLATGWRNRHEIASLALGVEALRGALVCLPLAALAMCGPFLMEAFLEWSSGFLHPWYAHPRMHLAGAVLAGGLSLWTSLALARFVRPSNRPAAYLVPALLAEGALAAIGVRFGRLEIAFPFVVGTGAILLAGWSQSAVRRGGIGLLGLAALAPYLSPTTYRMFLELSGVPIPRFWLGLAVGVLCFPWFLFLQHLACLPEALYARPGGLLLRARSGAILGLLAVSAGVVNACRPAYDGNHRALVEVREEVDPRRHRAEATLTSLETLRSIRLAGAGGRTLPDSTEARLLLPYPEANLPALIMEAAADPNGGVAFRVHGSVPGPPRWISLRFRGSAKMEVEREGTWQSGAEYRRFIFQPSAELDETLRFRGTEGAPLTVETVVAYDTDLLDLRPAGGDRTFRTAAFLRLQKKLL